MSPETSLLIEKMLLCLEDRILLRKDFAQGTIVQSFL